MRFTRIEGAEEMGPTICGAHVLCVQMAYGKVESPIRDGREFETAAAIST